MSTPTILDSSVCEQRANDAQRTAELLHRSGEEWAAVCYFYSAYHLVRAALIADPIFRNMTQLSQIDPNLTIGDQFVSRHKARIVKGQPRENGVNDVVAKLYPAVRFNYDRLHSVSVAVRYGQGLGAVSIKSVIKDFEVVRTAFDGGQLQAVF